MKKFLTIFKLLFFVLVVVVCDFKMASASSRAHQKSSDEREQTKDDVTIGADQYNRSISNRSTVDDRRHFQEAFDSSLAHIFRMKTRPKWNKTRIEIPEYMMALYNDQFSDDFRTGRHKRHSFPAANTIRSFNSEGLTGELSERGLQLRLRFDVTSIPPQETITGTELRLNYRPVSRPLQQRRTGSHVSNVTEAPRHLPRLKITAYLVTDPGSGYQTLQLPRSLDSKIVRQSDCVTCWASFDVTKAVQLWRQTPSLNRGLRVVIAEVRKEGKTGHRASSPRGFAYRFPGIQNEEGQGERQGAQPEPEVESPLLIVYSNDGTGPTIQPKPEVKSKGTRRTQRKRSAPTGSRKGGRKKDNRCRRHELHVDFHEVGWNDWIIAPAGYEAYSCQGDCPYYLPDNLNSTNHAVVQTLVHSVNPQLVPKPCCVPTSLKPISILYVDNSEKVIIKNYQDMVVEGCGCR